MTACKPYIEGRDATRPEKFAVATRLYAESAVCLAISGKSGIDFIRPEQADD
jgi:hypothetical protein